MVEMGTVQTPEIQMRPEAVEFSTQMGEEDGAGDEAFANGGEEGLTIGEEEVVAEEAELGELEFAM